MREVECLRCGHVHEVIAVNVCRDRACGCDAQRSITPGTDWLSVLIWVAVITASLVVWTTVIAWVWKGITQ